MAEVVIVDTADLVVGAMKRRQAQREGKIVRVVRLFLFNSRGELFIQRRGPRIDFAGLWDQSVGGHVNRGEDYLSAARREIREEIGLEELALTQIARYYTESEYGGGITYRRFNTLYTAMSDEPLKLHPVEVADGRWVRLDDLEREMSEAPTRFTQGFIRAVSIYLTWQDDHRVDTDKAAA